MKRHCITYVWYIFVPQNVIMHTLLYLSSVVFSVLNRKMYILFLTLQLNIIGIVYYQVKVYEFSSFFWTQYY